MTDRAVIFIDGSNWYHSMKDIRVRDPGALDYAKISMKLVGPREWIATRYYIGRAQYGKQYADQRRFLSRLEGSDNRISVHLGRLEPRPVKDSSAKKILQYLSNLTVRIDR